MTALQVIENIDHLDTYAKRIKQLMANWANNTLAIGAELTKAAETFPVNPKRPNQRPGFSKWARQATGLSESQINSLVAVYAKFGHRGSSGHLAGNVMRLLAQKNVPESARQEAISRAEKGEHVGHKEAQKIAKVHKLPSAKEANVQAKDEGRPVLARDGYIYFGTDPGRAKEGEDRRTMIYGVRKALDRLSTIHLTGRQFLDYALPHQLWNAEEAKVIKLALRWLTSLDEAWDNRS